MFKNLFSGVGYITSCRLITYYRMRLLSGTPKNSHGFSLASTDKKNKRFTDSIIDYLDYKIMRL